jgi:hypothetical protein
MLSREKLMKQKSQPERTLLQILRTVALGYPETQEGVACAGTSAEKRTIKVKGKAFLFLGMADVMLKLRESLEEATTLASKRPDRYKVGAHGWVTVTISNLKSLSEKLLLRWIDESYRLLASKHLVALLPKRNKGAGAEAG